METASEEPARNMTIMSNPKDSTDCQSGGYRCLLWSLGEVVRWGCLPCACLGCSPQVTVERGYTGLLMEFGSLRRVMPPGLYVINPLAQKVYPVSLKTTTLDVPQLSAMTKDNLSVVVDAVAYLTVIDPIRAKFEVEDYKFAVLKLVQSTIRSVIGELELSKLFAGRKAVSDRLSSIMSESCKRWGVSIDGVEFRDIQIPENMQRAMAQIAEASREAEAKVIIAKGQLAASQIFVEAAQVMGKEPASMQLQWFETLRTIAAEKNSTVVVPDSVLGALGGLGARTLTEKASAS